MHKHVYINGEWLTGKGGARQLLSPLSLEETALIYEADPSQAGEAIQAADQAYEQREWSQNAALRIRCLEQLAAKISENSDILAEIEMTNTGKPIREARLDAEDSAACLRYYASFIKKQQDRFIQMEDGSTSTVLQEPIGVCALIVPWNFPLLLGMWKIAPALAAGNTVVFKPSETTPLSILALTEMIDQCSFPKGVFNVVTGDGSIGEVLVNHPKVAKVSFTGGSETGRRINMQCAQSFKRVSLELGGKSPLIVLEDADIEHAAEWAVFGAFFNQGQVCVASSRLLVDEKIYDMFLTRLVEKTAAIRIGDPSLEETEMGPIITKEHLEKIERYIEIGRSEGAELLYGGERLERDGFFITPSIFGNVTQQMRIVQEEIFGPVVTVQSFRNEDDAVELANGTNFGLAAGVLSADVEKAERIASRLKAGTIWVNSYHTPYLEAPWGGMKQSGIGRELGPDGFHAFTEAKHINKQQLASSGWYS
ncbi:aldehyde dehydrogenase family protein [Domibacillus iocasae]|uniref:Betaine-aldehyde dehydrogenase n=1 Tax=Domibacillus iocasae TaxID=1714016 RepID=A0A1E7DP21_9BACI|nr:aldehyde dehydrogenase family protein [Domibacillus iocasae]OES44803.1 betaine-aldehyde dehydrogenase [Domibacillus iocasae]